MITNRPHKPECTPETKKQYFKTLVGYLPLNIDNKIVINYTKRFKNNDINGNSKYNYSFYGYNTAYCRIYDFTWLVANILHLKYDYNRMHIIGDSQEMEYIEKSLNDFNIKNDFNFKEIILKEII